MERSLKKESPSVDEIIDVDMRFHMAIARATKNEPVVNITEYITRITLPSRNATVRRILETPGETENFLDKVYGGSLGVMMSAMVGSRALTEEDIAELAAILERAKEETS